MGEIAAVLVALFSMAAVGMLMFYVLTVIAEWRIFNKMGEPGWISLIPLVRDYILYQRTWRTQWFWIWLVCMAFGAWRIFGGDDGGSLRVAAGAGAALLHACEQYRLSKSFGYGLLFTIGLIFLNPVFLLILGLGDSAYLGNPGEEF